MHGGPILRKKPVNDPFIDVLYRRKYFGRNPQTSWGRPISRPKPKPKPREKSEIDLYLERIGYDRR